MVQYRFKWYNVYSGIHQINPYPGDKIHKNYAVNKSYLVDSAIHPTYNQPQRLDQFNSQQCHPL